MPRSRLWFAAFTSLAVACSVEPTFVSGDGGNGGNGGDGGHGGDAAEVTCTTVDECPGEEGECAATSCDAGICRTAFAPSGTAAAEQTPGNCLVRSCDGSGNVVEEDDDDDVPIDGETCTADVCTAGAPSNPPAAAGTACGTDLALTCDGAGKCSGCVEAPQCGETTECGAITCVSGKCNTTLVPLGGGDLGGQIDGDCRRRVCDGLGGEAVIVDDTDVPPAEGSCKQGACSNGVPGQQNLSSGTACGEAGLCDGTGACKGCLQASDCGASTACTTWSCDAGTCAKNDVANGTSCSDGNACTHTDTCQSGSCAGGNPVTCAAVSECHNAGTCNAETGVCSNPQKANGAACNDGSACTQTDTCQSGTCTGSNPVVCMAPACQVPGTCAPATGTCSAPTPDPNETRCGNCGLCSGGSCVGQCSGAQSLCCEPGICVGSGQFCP